jgi:aspartyl-tRNA(Asn)/glutamyl-tRNA(Gln) amidotransferase subunit A
MGSDASGSIRNPAGWCAVSGLKPTYGLLSRRGIFPLAPSFDTAGPMAWTAEDCALMSRYSPATIRSTQCRRAASPSLTGRRRASQSPGLRVGLIRHWYAHADGATADIICGVDEAAKVFKELGCVVEEIAMPNLFDYQACARIIIRSEGHATYRRALNEHSEKFGYTTRRRQQLGAFLTAEQYVAAMHFRRKLQIDTDTAMRDFDLVMTANHYRPADGFDDPPVFHFLGKPPLPNPFNVTG